MSKRSPKAASGGGGGKRVKAAKSPWHQFMAAVDARRRAVNGYTLRWEGVLDKVDEESAPDDFDEVEEWSESRIEAYVSSLSGEVVAEQEILFVIANGEAFCDFANKGIESIRYADPRNSPGDSFCMYTTSSSYYMQEAIIKLLGKAQKVVNAAMKRRRESGAPLTAAEAAPAVAAACGMGKALQGEDHWFRDTEEDDNCNAIAKKTSKLFADLMTLTDEELGFDEEGAERSRHNMMVWLDGAIGRQWAEFADDVAWNDFVFKYKLPRNGHGMGKAPGPAKAKAAAGSSAASAAATAAGDGPGVALARITPQLLAARQKAEYQLHVTFEEDGGEKQGKQGGKEQHDLVVGGAMSLAKLNHTVAFAFDLSPGGAGSAFDHHPQKAKTMEGSHFELQLPAPGSSSASSSSSMATEVVWVCSKSAGKKAVKAGHARSFVEDKAFKVAHLFQGYTPDPQGGMAWDSDQSRDVAASVAFVSGGTAPRRLTLTAVGVTSTKGRHGSSEPLPRIVAGSDAELAYDDRRNCKHLSKWGNRRKNAAFRNGRGGPSYVFLRTDTAAAQQKCFDNGRFQPLFHADGSLYSRRGSRRGSGEDDDSGDKYDSFLRKFEIERFQEGAALLRPS